MIGCTPGFRRGGLAHLSHLGLHEIYAGHRQLVAGGFW